MSRTRATRNYFFINICDFFHFLFLENKKAGDDWLSIHLGFFDEEAFQSYFFIHTSEISLNLFLIRIFLKPTNGVMEMTNEIDGAMTPKIFFNKLLAGIAQGTIIALIPNAVIGAILKYFAHITIINMIINAALIFQVATPLIIAALIAKQFNLAPAKTMIVGGAAFAASGVIKFDNEAGVFIASGTGDIINIMLTAAVAVLMMMWIGSKLGSVEIIALPIVVGIGAALVGMLMYPYVTQITVTIGQVINDFTNFQPVILISRQI